MSETIIKVENLSKLYRLGEIGTGTLSHDLNRWWARLRGKEDPFAKIGHLNDQSAKAEKGEIVWALKDINFDIEQGEVLGIIGKNGAGKSTLLKILSQVTTPTTGNIKVRGRIASLLEVGTGFHPELTGRENIFLNGAILGMTKTEIRSKFDEIVDFAGVAKYIDTPVKRYSSGMYVRLAFAVAAHLEPEILVVDEVLAVGDAEFQKKALGKMQDVSTKDGRTVLFVSHNMAAVKSLCKKGLVLSNGTLSFYGTQMEAVNFYQSSENSSSCFEHHGKLDEAPGNDSIRILKFEVLPLSGTNISISSGFQFCLTFFNHTIDRNLALTFELRTIDETIVFHHGTWLFENRDSKKGEYAVKGKILPNILNAGIYKFNFIIAESLHSILFQITDFVQFEILNESLSGNNNILPGLIRPRIEYDITHLSSR